MNIGCGYTEVLADGVQFVGGVRKLRQRQRELAAIDTGTLPELGIGKAREAARRRAPLIAAFGRIEQGIAEASHRLHRLVAPQSRAAPSDSRATAAPRPPGASGARPHYDTLRSCRGSRPPASPSP